MTLSLSQAFIDATSNANIKLQAHVVVKANRFPFTCLWPTKRPNDATSLIVKDAIGRHDLHSLDGYQISYYDGGIAGSFIHAFDEDLTGLFSPDHEDFEPGASNFLFAGWFYNPSSTPGDSPYRIFSKTSVGNTATQFHLEVENGTGYIKLSYAPSLSITSTEIFPANQWVFLWCRRVDETIGFGWTPKSAGVFDSSYKASAACTSFNIGVNNADFFIGGQPSPVGTGGESIDHLYWIVGDTLLNGDLEQLYNNGSGTDGLLEDSFGWLSGSRGYYMDGGIRVPAPLVVASVKPNFSRLDPVKHSVSMGECSVDLLLGKVGKCPVRAFFRDYHSQGKLITITVGTPELDIDDYAPFFSGTITDTQISDGILTVSAQNSTAQALDLDFDYPISNMHPIEAIMRAVVECHVPASLIDLASINYDSIKTDPQYSDCTHLVVRGRNTVVRHHPSPDKFKLSDFISRMCAIFGGYFIPSETGKSVLTRYDATVEVADTWRPEDYTDFKQETTDGQVENSLVMQWQADSIPVRDGGLQYGHMCPYGIIEEDFFINNGVANFVISQADADPDGFVYYSIAYSAGTMTVSWYKDKLFTDKICAGSVTDASPWYFQYIVYTAESGHASAGIGRVYMPPDGSLNHQHQGTANRVAVTARSVFALSNGFVKNSITISDETAVIETVTPGNSDGSSGGSVDELMVNATGLLYDDITDEDSSFIVSGDLWFLTLHGFAGTAYNGSYDPYRRPDATRPIYLLCEKEIIKCTDQTCDTTIAYETYQSTTGGDPILYPLIPRIAYAVSERGALGTEAKSHDGGVLIHDVTTLVMEGLNRTTRFSHGKNVVTLKTSFEKYKYQQGQMVRLVNSSYLSYGYDGLDEDNAVKWEIIEKQPDIDGSPPCISWKLMRA
jgi:hypothetical protein